MEIKRFDPPSTQYFLGAKYVRNPRGYYVRSAKRRELGTTKLHRDMWTHFNGPIPDDYVIHHRDHDRSNNTMGNFELMTKAEHDALTQKELMQDVMCVICLKKYKARKCAAYDYSICSKACEKRAALLRKNPNAAKRNAKPIIL